MSVSVCFDLRRVRALEKMFFNCVKHLRIRIFKYCVLFTHHRFVDLFGVGYILLFNFLHFFTGPKNEPIRVFSV